jgi:chaperonin cofactor prefoldin
MARAIENRDLQKNAEKLKLEAVKLEERLKNEKTTAAEMGKLETHRIVLKTKLEEIEKAKNEEETDASLQKLIENMKLEIAALKKERPPLSKRLNELQMQLKERADAPEPEESVVIRPGGIGSRGAKNLFFVECTSTGIVIRSGGDEPKIVSTAAIGTSEDYNAFLDNVKKTRDSMVLFLIRKGGNNAYNWAAGWAESKYEVRTGKLPVPNEGKIDLTLFD